MAQRADNQEVSHGRVYATEAQTPERHDGSSRTEHIRREIESTRAALDEKLDVLGSRVRHVQDRARNAVDVRHQIAAHPWAALGASVAAGYLLGSMLGDRDEERSYARLPAYGAAAGGGGMLHAVSERVSGAAHAVSDRLQDATHAVSQRVQHAAHSFQSSGNSPRNDIFDTLKVAAGAAITDMFRQGIRRYMPALGEQLDQVWDEKGLTPTRAASALFSGGGRSSSRQAPQGGSQQHSRDSGYGYDGGDYASGGEPAAFGRSGQRIARDFDPTVEPGHEHTMRGEVTSRS
jgi:ElaB/YqjD/DUF883 family membrane-anchored ribosome-binding protein